MAKIFYFSLRDEQPRQDKLTWFAATKFKNVVFEQITPDEKHNWINLTDNNWDSLMPVCDKTHKNTIFKFYSLGVSTNRDEWVYDFDKNNLTNKINYFINTYNDLLATNDLSWNTSIKWSEALKNQFNKKRKLQFDTTLLLSSNYRPFVKQFYYAANELSDRLTQNHYQLFGSDLQQKNLVIEFLGNDAPKPFSVISADTIIDLNHLSPAAAGTKCLPLHTYDAHGNQVENITDWALEQFRAKYGASCSKLDIFHYIYAVLHHPTYRQTYEQNLKRDFPRVPLYDDLAQWAAWGKALLDLHIEYETAEPYALQRVDVLPKPKKKKDESLFAETTVEPLFETPRPTVAPKTKLRADKELGEIQLDEQTKLTGVPPQAWAYKLGNRSALEWILDQYKESNPSDPTIREQFNTYRFADYKDHVIDLLCRVCTVSVQTMDIISQMPS